MWNKIFDIYWYSIGYRMRNFYVSIKNIIRWLPVIYKDKDWDDSFIFDILKFKIQNVAKYTVKRKFYEGWSRDVEYMNTCIRLIDKLCDDYYGIEYIHDDMIWKFDDNLEKHQLTQDEIDNNNKLFKKFLSKNKSTHRQVLKHLELHSDRYSSDKSNLDLQALLVSQFKHEKCRKLLFKILEQKIEGWWD